MDKFQNMTDREMFEHDDKLFREQLNRWINPDEVGFFAYLNCGLGDTFCFRHLLPEIKKKHKNVTVATCYKEAFFDEIGINLIDLDAGQALAPDVERYNIYKYAHENNWKGSLINAYRRLYDL